MSSIRPSEAKNPPTPVAVRSRPGRPHKALVVTPPTLPDLEVVAMSWWQMVLIRTARTYLQSVLGNLTNVGIAGGVAVTTFANLTPEQQMAIKQAVSALEFYQLLLIALSTAVAPAVIALLQNAVELLTRLDHPRTRA